MSISYNQIMFNIRRGIYRYLGAVSSREVFDLNNGYVAKVAKNMAGIEQNRTEFGISYNDKSKLFAKVVDASRDYSIIIMRKGDKVNSISQVWKYFNVKNKYQFLNLYEIRSISKKYTLVLSDLNKESSWGIIDGRLQIIDYGYTRVVKDRYY